jgi:hypothetical protein
MGLKNNVKDKTEVPSSESFGVTAPWRRSAAAAGDATAHAFRGLAAVTVHAAVGGDPVTGLFRASASLDSTTARLGSAS